MPLNGSDCLLILTQIVSLLRDIMFGEDGNQLIKSAKTTNAHLCKIRVPEYYHVKKK